MTRALVATCALLLIAAAGPGASAQPATGNGGEKQLLRGPVKQTFGALDVVLGEGSSAEVRPQPDASRLSIHTLQGEARVVTSARYLVLVENEEGTVEVTLPTGRRIAIEPGRSDIVGRALVDDPGTISIRIASTAHITVLEGVPAAALSGVVTTPTPINPVTGPRPETSTLVSPSSVTGPRGFGTSTP
ncbi:MAG TPA: hypothetical protein VFC42_11910 [Methylomirabilota bacterium]|jgi:hypothetical protein|nr:hypothetical protein [Methylomirabilota bacterium]